MWVIVVLVDARALQSGLKYPAFSGAAIECRLEFSVPSGKLNQSHSPNPCGQTPAIRLRTFNRSG